MKIIKLSQKQAHVLLNFLQDATYVQMDKQQHETLNRLSQDVKSLQVSSKRVNAALPLVRATTNVFRGMAARTLRYASIERWMRVLVVPAVVKYLLRVRPAKRRFVKNLDEVARITTYLEKESR